MLIGDAASTMYSSCDDDSWKLETTGETGFDTKIDVDELERG